MPQDQTPPRPDTSPTAAPAPDGFAAFAAEARARGFDTALIRDWDPNHQTPPHSHPFDTEALVVRGTVTLTFAGTSRVLAAGARFAVPRDIEHAETYGPEGATFWAARRQ
jgi:hypothetical protein